MDPTVALGIGIILGLVLGGVGAGYAVYQALRERISAKDAEIALRVDEHEREIAQNAAATQREIDTLHETQRSLHTQWLQEKRELLRSKAEALVAKDREIQNLKETSRELLTTERKAAQESRQTLQARLDALQRDEQRLQNAFAKLAGDSLSENSGKFLQLAEMKISPLVDLQKRLEAEIKDLAGR